MVCTSINRPEAFQMVISKASWKGVFTFTKFEVGFGNTSSSMGPVSKMPMVPGMG
jgi:hypothetical protein